MLYRFETESVLFYLVKTCSNICYCFIEIRSSLDPSLIFIVILDSIKSLFFPPSYGAEISVFLVNQLDPFEVIAVILMWVSLAKPKIDGKIQSFLI